ncbi:MAG: GNAT family N-acetyltransferase [Pseudomonadota bacterium]|nr:GNAT family N-acetyltransferase [Pseudomonadota bacterium]
MQPLTAPIAAPARWQWSAFDDLDVHALDAIYRARQLVFALEQDCVYLDVDGHDAHAFHIAAWPASGDLPLAYARVLAPGRKYAEASIGRVLTTESARGTGLGRELVRRAIASCQQVFPGHGIRISAQTRLERFYAGFGFEPVGAPYDEDGISHTEMLRPFG